MIVIQYPEHNFKIKEEEGCEMIFDELRKKWVVLTPEEWVRQNTIQYFIRAMEYPKELISIEKELKIRELKKRFDIVIYDKKIKPWILVECKSMETFLNEEVITQALIYNQKLSIKYLIVTNGKYTRGFQLTYPDIKEIDFLPRLL